MKREDAAHRMVSPTLHVTVGLLVATFVSAVTASFLLRVDVVARGQGRVVPVDRVQVIQSEYRGRISAIAVQDGHEVVQGDILITLDATEAEAEINTLDAERTRLRLEQRRREAFLAWMNMPEETRPTPKAVQLAGLTGFEPLMREQDRLLASDAETLHAALEQMDTRIATTRRALQVIEADQDRITTAMESQSEREAIAQDLLDRGVSSRAAYLDVADVMRDLRAQREVLSRRFEQTTSEIDAISAERKSLVSARRNDTLQRLFEIEARLVYLDESRRAAQRRLEAVHLRAPVDGIVTALSTHTIGGVVESGEDILQLVPSAGSVEIEAVFLNTDAGFLEPGQPAKIALDPYPSERFGHLSATVVDISADSVPMEGGAYGYVVRLEADAESLERGDRSLPLRPGMTAEIGVTTDERRLIEYFLSPITEVVQNSLGER